MDDAGTLSFGVLGPLELTRAGRSVTPTAPKQRALLALLLLNANGVVSTDRLIDDLWGEAPPTTAQGALQVHISQLRRLLEPDRARDALNGVLVTRPPGYLLKVAPGQLDLHRFERLTAEGAAELADGRAETAARKLREALALWRGPALDDLLFEPFAETPAARLEELRLAALEKRLEADLVRGRHAEVVAELQELATEHPLREGLAAQLMLALYRSGRQAEALEAYQRTRRILVEELGIEPAPSLQRLERGILMQDPELDLPASDATAFVSGRVVLVLVEEGEQATGVLDLAEQLSLGDQPHELVLARVLDPADGEQLAAATVSLSERCADLGEMGIAARVAAFTSVDRAADLARLASRSDVDLLLVPADPAIRRDGDIDRTLATLLRQVLCDVAFLASRNAPAVREGPVLVPFGAGEHDWAALELGAWLAGGGDRPLHLLGTTAETESGRRDASRLLADAGLLVQRASGVLAVPRLVPAGHEGLLEAAAQGGLLVVGLSERWQEEGLGLTRWGLARSASVPVLFVRRGLRPGGLATDASATRFGWSVSAAAPAATFEP